MSLFLLLLAACGCPDFDDIELVDATSTGLSEAEVDDLWGVIDWFEANTGLAGVCVDEVQVEDDTRMWFHDVGGYYSGSRNKIWVDREAAPQTLAHELCHAVDDTLGSVSLERPDLFDPASVETDIRYRNRKSRTREAFARSCEYVQLDDTLARAKHEHCGVPYENPALEWYRDVVFVDYTPATRLVEFAPLARLEPHRLDQYTDGRPLRAVAGTDEHVVLIWHPVSPTPSHDPDLAPLTLAFVDPSTGTDAARVELMLDTPFGLAALHGSDAVTLVLADTDSRLQTLRVTADGALARRELPEQLRGIPDHGWEDEAGVLWLAGTTVTEASDACGVATWDPAHGEVQACPRTLADLGPYTGGEAVPSAGGWLLPLDDGEGWVLASPATGTVRPMNGGPRRLAVTTDDHLWIRDTDHLPGADLTIAGLGRWNPNGDALTLEAGICEGAPPEHSWLALVGDTAWMVDDPDGSGANMRLEQLPL